MDQKIINRANQLLSDKQYGHELTWDRAVRLAQEEAQEKTERAAAAKSERELTAQFRSDLHTAGVAEATVNVLVKERHDLPWHIQTGRIRFASAEKEKAVKAAIRKLYLALGYGEPDFKPLS